MRKQLFNWADKIENVNTDHREIEKFLPEIKQKFEKFDREELLRRVVSLQFEKFLDDYRNGDDPLEIFNEKELNHKNASGKKSQKQYQGNYKRLFINLGKADGFYAQQLIELVNKNTKGGLIGIGKIDLMKSFSFFEVDGEYADAIIGALSKTKFRERRIAIEIAQEKSSKVSKGKYTDQKQSRWKERINRKRLGKELYKTEYRN